MDVTTFAHAIILGVLLPAWLLLGVFDWWCHKQAHIETTAGPWESFLHLVLSGQAAVAVLAALFLDINAPVLLLIIFMYVVHELATGYDIHYAARTRVITPTEQRVHDYLTAVPFAIVILLFATHPSSALDILTLRFEEPFVLRWKEPQLPLWYTLSLLAACIAANIVLFAEELWRGLKARRAALQGPS
jgi:hypothetical protein